MKTGRNKISVPSPSHVKPLPGLDYGGIQPTHYRDHNAVLNEREFIGKKIELTSRPRYLFVELTSNCNLSCPMCRDRVAYDKSKDMPFDLFCSIADELFPYAEVVDLRGWGESLIYPMFTEAVEYAAHFGCQLKIYTNLTVSRQEVIDCLMENRVITAVSFDAGARDTFRRIRRGSTIGGVLRNLQRLVEARNAYGIHSDYVYFSTTIQQENLTEISEIARIASDHDIRLLKLFPLCVPLTDHNHPFNNKTIVLRLIGHLRELSDKFSLKIDLGASLHPDLTVPYGRFTYCSHPWTHCYLSYQGSIGFCDHLIGLPYYSLAEWKDGAFHTNWNNSLFRRLRVEHAKGFSGLSECFRDCRWCYAFRYVDIEHWLRPIERNRLVSTCNERPMFSTNATHETCTCDLEFP